MDFAIRVIGAAMVCISSTIVGYYLSMRNDFRAADLREFKRALAILKSEIEYSLNILPFACDNIASKTQGEVSRFFQVVAARLSDDDGVVVAQVWQEKVDNDLRNSHLIAEDAEQIAQLGKTLGYLDPELQLRGIDILNEYLDKNIETAEAAAGKNKRMLRSLGFICGLVVVVVLF